LYYYPCQQKNVFAGVLQERITSVSYTSVDGAQGKWKFPLALNACMALASLLASGLVLLLVPPSMPQPPSREFWKPALTCTLASPFGCKLCDTTEIVLYFSVLERSHERVSNLLLFTSFYGRHELS
jgi:hypothetical protein